MSKDSITAPAPWKTTEPALFLLVALLLTKPLGMHLVEARVNVGHLLGREDDVSGGEVLTHAGGVGGAGDGYEVRALVEDPGKAELRPSALVLLGVLLQQGIERGGFGHALL